ncbi:hypothetical protein [Kocuria rhizosphaericola]|uniref:hypothetical protein n=1 Tax=Kocuria rhizosphaericola TaxID=3376284 RepID=UPI0037961B71
MANADKIRSAAAALKIKPAVLMALSQESGDRHVKVPLELLDGEPIYVFDEQQARELKLSDRAFKAVTAA